MLWCQGTGIITGDPEEPLYGRCYLPRKFKIAVTVPGKLSTMCCASCSGVEKQEARACRPADVCWLLSSSSRAAK